MKTWRDYIIISLAILAASEAYVVFSYHSRLVKYQSESLQLSALDEQISKELLKKIDIAQAQARDLQAAIDRSLPETLDSESHPSTAVTRNSSDARQARSLAHDWLTSLADPELAGAVYAQQRDRANKQYAELLALLKLSPDRRDQLLQLLVEKKQVALEVASAALEQGKDIFNNPEALKDLISSERANIESQIKSLLGDDGYDNYKAFDLTMGQSNLIARMQKSLKESGAPLTSDQLARLQQVISDNHVGHLNDKILSSAAGIVDQRQFDALERFYQLQQAGSRAKKPAPTVKVGPGAAFSPGKRSS